MRTATALDILTDVAPDATYEEEVPADVIHGVHGACQRDAFVKTTRCGIAVEDSGQHSSGSTMTTTELCPACDEVRVCPLCQTPLGSMAAALSHVVTAADRHGPFHP